MSRTTYRDRNGNTRQKWKRYSYSDREVEYVRNEGDKSLFVKTYPEWKKDQHKEAPYRWVIQDKNKIIGGWSKNLNDAKYDAASHINGEYDGYCPEGYEFVHSYTKPDGTHVSGFCRRRR